MIARFRVLLPYTFSIPYLHELEPIRFSYDEYEVTVFPPATANVDASIKEVTSKVPLIDGVSNLKSAAIISPTEAIKINGQETIQANLLQIDFRASRDFDRRKEITAFDPQPQLMFFVANRVISRLRSVGRISHVFQIHSGTVPGWRVEYLDDNGNELAEDDRYRRSNFVSAMSYAVSGLTADVWRMASELPDGYVVNVWDELILDARAQLPDINTAIVLANAALESFISFSLDILAEASALAPESWKWISVRDENWLKQPSLKEKLNELLFLIAGRSLKREELELWQMFDQLRAVRNSIVHDGRAVLKRKTRKNKRYIETPVDSKLADTLIAGAEKIIKWLENILPETDRRVLFKGPTTFEFNRDMTGPESSTAELWGVQSSKEVDVRLKPTRK